MPATSKAQQRFFGMCSHANHPPSSCPTESMSREQMRDFAKTKHEGLPERAKKKKA